MSDSVTVPRSKIREILEKIGDLRGILRGGKQDE